jgi:hypothetical protein
MSVREDGETDRQWQDDPADWEDLRPFNCPFCGKVMDWEEGGCSHYVFTYEMVNFVYVTLDSDFRELVLRHLHGMGYKDKELPCPLEGWAEYYDGDESRVLPSLDKVVPGLELMDYQYSGPHGHGSWGVVLGFMKDMRRSGEQTLVHPWWDSQVGG